VNDCRCADLDVGTRLDASALPASWRHEGSTGHTLQGGDWYGEHSYVCAVCGVRFELVEYEDSPERRTISARSAPEPPPPPPSAPRLEYAGTWRDPRGRCLVIRRVGAAYEVDYLGSDG